MNAERINQLADAAMQGSVCAGERTAVLDAIRSAIAEEREACAELCDEREKRWYAAFMVALPNGGRDVVYSRASEARTISAEIRSRT